MMQRRIFGPKGEKWQGNEVCVLSVEELLNLSPHQTLLGRLRGGESDERSMDRNACKI
jgi:hypothetical protein